MLNPAYALTLNWQANIKVICFNIRFAYISRVPYLSQKQASRNLSVIHVFYDVKSEG